MKVYLGKPRYHWISPYKIIEHVFFWTDWSKCGRSKDFIPDEKYVDHPKWVDKLADKIEPLSVLIQKVLDKIHPEVNYVKIDYWDVWSMDHTLSPIILPMLIQLKKVKHGSGYVDLEDVPEHLRYTTHEDWDDNHQFDFYKNYEGPKIDCDVHTRYEWLLDELIWTFTQLSDDNNGENQFWHDHGEIDFSEHPEDVGKKTRPLRWLRESKVDWEGLRAHQARIQNGLKLFGKYYQTLWD